MIEDIEGATSEPARRRHVVVLSGAVAIASLVLLFAQVAPQELVTTRQAASPAASANAGPGTTIVTGSMMFFRSGDVNVKLVSECADGTQTNPRYLVFEGNGQVMSVPLDASKARSGWLTVPCATSTNRIPLLDRRR